MRRSQYIFTSILQEQQRWVLAAACLYVNLIIWLIPYIVHVDSKSFFYKLFVKFIKIVLCSYVHVD